MVENENKHRLLVRNDNSLYSLLWQLKEGEGDDESLQQSLAAAFGTYKKMDGYIDTFQDRIAPEDAKVDTVLNDVRHDTTPKAEYNTAPDDIRDSTAAVDTKGDSKDDSPPIDMKDDTAPVEQKGDSGSFE
jgi:hypothetical protein